MTIMAHGSTPLLVFYICAETIGLVLAATATYFLTKSTSFISKWTLTQYFTAFLLYKLSSLLSILESGNALAMNKGQPSVTCVIQANFNGLLLYPLSMTPAVLALYMWYAVSKNRNVENDLYGWFTFWVWAFAVVGSLVQLGNSLNFDDFGVRRTLGVCELSDIGRHKLWLAIPTFAFSVFGLPFSLASIYALISIWFRQIERTVLENRYAVYLILGCLFSNLWQAVSSCSLFLGESVDAPMLEPIGFFCRLIAIPGMFIAFVILKTNNPIKRCTLLRCCFAAGKDNDNEEYDTEFKMDSMKTLTETSRQISPSATEHQWPSVSTIIEFNNKVTPSESRTFRGSESVLLPSTM